MIETNTYRGVTYAEVDQDAETLRRVSRAVTKETATELLVAGSRLLSLWSEVQEWRRADQLLTEVREITSWPWWLHVEPLCAYLEAAGDQEQADKIRRLTELLGPKESA